MKMELDVASHGDPVREQLSALLDGEHVDGNSAIWPALARENDLLSSWADYQRIGDAMRGGSQLAGQGNELAFVASFRERLAAEEAVVPATAKVVPFPVPAVAPAVERRAANDGVYRWKMVAGLATVMAVLVVGWAALEEPAVTPTVPVTQEVAMQSTSGASNPTSSVVGSVPGSSAGMVAVSAPSQASSAVALLPQGGLRRVSQPGLVVDRDASGAVGSRYALQAANDGVDSVMIRDPRLDEFLAAHRQGNASALQTPVDFVRDAVVQSNP